MEMLDNIRYEPEDWTMDLILVLTENQEGDDRRRGANWKQIRDALDALEWPLGHVEDILSEAMDHGIIFEPVLGHLRLRDHEAIMGRISGNLLHLDHTIPENFRHHGEGQRRRFRAWVNTKLEVWSQKKDEPSTLADLQIRRVPGHIAEEILNVLKKYPNNGITIHYLGGN
jgi:hypothetical protein